MRSTALRFEQPVDPINAFQTSCGTVTVTASDDGSTGQPSDPSPGGGGVVPGVPDQVALLAVVLLLAVGAVVVL